MIAPKPPLARQHCRHYSYVVPYTEPNAGPNCAIGVDLSAPRSTLPCMPNGTGCAEREDWTEQERAAWGAWQAAGQERMIAAIAALPSLAANQSTTVTCPNCQGELTYQRTARRAYVQCLTEHCCRFETALKPDAKVWP